ncbi:hypothetical protein [Marinimicrobium agarilyticum]|uniref:hypothetical protein n=1 Tax=Marinimicrobium agarilyticum TaxID=306546 RepID=UPI00041C96DF|nr:hypothetical protein [Marinimicrobium agarilyticum]
MALAAHRFLNPATVPLLLGGWLAFHVAAAAEPSSALLQAPDAEHFYQPREPLHLSLAENAVAEAPGQLSLELDGMDVSALVQRRELDWTYVPARPLAPGLHELRLMFYGDRGGVRELGRWRFEVRHSRALRSASVEGQLDLALSQRVAQSDDIGGDDFGAQGGGYLASEVSGDRWQLRSSLDLMAVNDEALAIAGRKLDLARFQVRGDLDRYHLTLGDQQLASASLIQDGFERRGISTGARLPLWDGALSAYQATGQQTVGIDAGLGTDEHDNRLSGGQLSFWPWRGDEAQVMITGERLSGRISQPGYGSLEPAADPVVHEGEAWNVTMDGQFVQRQLRVRLEKAESEYDFDGINQGFDPEAGEAWSALMILDPTPSGMDALDWRLGLEAKKMGTWYKSLANRYAPADKKLKRLFFDMTKNQWSWDGSYAVEDSNLTEDIDYAISETRQWNLRASYFDYELPSGPVLTFLGQPNYTLTASGTTLIDDYTPEGYLANDLQTRRYGMTAAFTKARLQWSAGYHYDTLEDATGWQPETRTQATQLDAGWSLTAEYHFFIGWEFQHTTYPEQGVSTDRHIYSFDANAEFIPGRLHGGVSVGLNQTSARDDPFYAQWDQTTYLSSHLNWRLREPDRNSAGWEFILSVTRNDYRDQLFVANSVDGYQAFIELRTTLPVAYPGARP